MMKVKEVSGKSEVIKRNMVLKAWGKDRCFLCEKPLTYVAANIHVCLCCNTILAEGERGPTGYDEDGEGGCGYFPVGSECVKRLPKEYRQ